MNIIYKIASKSLWNEAIESGTFPGAPVDIADGYIHFSTAEQVKETAAKHFAGQNDLLLVTFNADAMGEKLIWEPSRGGALFPHLYRTLKTSEALEVLDLPLGEDGNHVFPEGI